MTPTVMPAARFDLQGQGQVQQIRVQLIMMKQHPFQLNFETHIILLCVLDVISQTWLYYIAIYSYTPVIYIFGGSKMSPSVL